MCSYHTFKYTDITVVMDIKDKWNPTAVIVKMIPRSYANTVHAIRYCVSYPCCLDNCCDLSCILVFSTVQVCDIYLCTCITQCKLLIYSGFVRVLENLESPGILLWHFPGLEGPEKRLLVLESSGNLLNSLQVKKKMKCMVDS